MGRRLNIASTQRHSKPVMKKTERDQSSQTAASDGWRWDFCSSLSSFPTNDLIVQCTKCSRFVARCCQHRNSVCHHYPLIFVDGACIGNGGANALAGIGITIGDDEGDEVTHPITNAMDPGKRRTSQRAELLAALYGVRFCREKECASSSHSGDKDPMTCIIATDSEYVSKGISEWYPRWKANNYRKGDGTVPSNLDLFQSLEAELEDFENATGTKICIWNIPRGFNQKADRLAKEAAKSGDP